MSDANLPVFNNTVFTNPNAAPPLAFSNPSNVVLSATPAQIGGTGVAITTQANTNPAAPVQLAVFGTNNTVSLGTGAAWVNAVGGGAIIESVQLVNSQGAVVTDAGKALNVGGGSPTLPNGSPNPGFVPNNGGTIDTSVVVSGNTIGSKETIAQAGGSQTPSGGFGFYVHGGTGNDTIVGSVFNDFLRGGAGNDLIDADAGNDLVRGGTGNDTVTLGAGVDTLYYTSDQVGGNNFDAVTDFTSGTDKIAIQNGAGIVVTNLAGQALTSASTPVQAIVFRVGSSGPTTTLTSGRDAFRFSDITFIG
jgi:Ca2+-binding RTX toxin-like protein